MNNAQEQEPAAPEQVFSRLNEDLARNVNILNSQLNILREKHEELFGTPLTSSILTSVANEEINGGCAHKGTANETLSLAKEALSFSLTLAAELDEFVSKL